MMPDIKILDIIRPAHGRFYLILNRLPVLVYKESTDEKKRRWLIAVDGSFSDRLYHSDQRPKFKAFAGREFDLKMADGSTLHAAGEWWHYQPYNLINPAITTPEKLANGYAFECVSVDPKFIEDWLDNHAPKDDYRYYEQHRDQLLALSNESNGQPESCSISRSDDQEQQGQKI